MAYKHGAEASENRSQILTVNSGSANIAFIVGTAPINLTDETDVNVVQRLANEDDAVKLFGFDKNYAKYSLSEAIDIFFTKYRVGPVYMVNVLDPAVHFKSADPETIPQINRKATLSQLGAIPSTVEVRIDTTLMVKDVDYQLLFNDQNKLVITTLVGGNIKESDVLEVSYNVLDPSMVTADDIIGKITATGDYTGIKLVHTIYPEFNEVVGTLTAPHWTHITNVKNELITSANNLSDQFTANVTLDLDTSSISWYPDAVKVKSEAVLDDPRMNLCLGDLYIDDVKYTHSLYLAAHKQYIAQSNGDVPNINPSNKTYIGINGYKLNGKSLTLTKSMAEYLNGNGIIVSRKITGSWRCWGNRTACFPANKDPKDFDIALRDMGNWLLNNIIIFTEQEVDGQMDRAWLTRIIGSVQGWLDSLKGSGKLITGNYSVPLSKNPLNDIANGLIRFLLEWTSPGTASAIITEGEFNVQDLLKPLENLQG